MKSLLTWTGSSMLNDEQLFDLLLHVFESFEVECEADSEREFIVIHIMNMDSTICIENGLVTFCPNFLLSRDLIKSVDLTIKSVLIAAKWVKENA